MRFPSGAGPRLSQYDEDVEFAASMTRLTVGTAALVLLSFSSTARPQSPAPAAGPAVTSTASVETATFQKVEDAWSMAFNQPDQYGMELVLSPLFMDIAADGDVTTRNQQIVALLKREDKSLHLEQKVIAVRMLGDVAVVNGTYTLHHRVGNEGKDEKGVFTHVFQRVHGNWLCTNSQRTAVRDDAPAGKTKKKPQSTADQPFHIPLFTKDKKD